MVGVENWVERFDRGYNLDGVMGYEELREDDGLNG